MALCPFIYLFSDLIIIHLFSYSFIHKEGGGKDENITQLLNYLFIPCVLRGSEKKRERERERRKVYISYIHLA